MPEISLSRGYTLIAHGPARVRVLEGSVHVFGATLGAGSEAFAEPTRSLPLHATENTKLHVETGSFSLFEGDTTPGEWYSLAETILEEGLRRVIVVGDVDSGKTSLVTLLVNALAGGGRRVAVIDADVGQKSIGPPGTVGLGVTDRQVYTLTSIEMHDAFFIGSNTPSGILHRSLTGVALLLRKAEKLSDFTVIDTTGWVTDSEGRELKLFKAFLTEPDLVVLVGDPRTLAQIERPLKKLFRVVRVPRPRAVFERRREDRREYRRWMYSKYLSRATVKSVDIESIDMAYAFSFTGFPLTPSEKAKLEGILGVGVLYAERSDDHLGAVVLSQPIQQAVELAKNVLGVRHARIISGFELVHSVVGFMSREKYCEGIGVITSFNPHEKQISVLTQVESLSDKLWLLGVQKVNPSSFEEEAGLEKWFI
ncbi:hypothetical protein IG193_06705 [Infirmifilum lucidum]|uniref:polynucleotide 5'-hydroxyl-kinase n=1 Tax=Infirmifilum lucidum TaxID=2776706 RepID=A0A7L9FF89_9CREN|nr:Clp1/GlmU family protein [Infirmifilum lucidum]QOJ78440.1 hypothetical protein IG193_06705 [Infirmifilum lucidum]